MWGTGWIDKVHLACSRYEHSDCVIALGKQQPNSFCRHSLVVREHIRRLIAHDGSSKRDGSGEVVESVKNEGIPNATIVLHRIRDPCKTKSIHKVVLGFGEVSFIGVRPSATTDRLCSNSISRSLVVCFREADNGRIVVLFFKILPGNLKGTSFGRLLDRSRGRRILRAPQKAQDENRDNRPYLHGEQFSNQRGTISPQQAFSLEKIRTSTNGRNTPPSISCPRRK